MTKAVEDVVSRMVPGVEQLSGLPKTHLLRALLAGQMLELFKAPLFLPSHASSAAVQKLWTDIKSKLAPSPR